jgi:hypothetical protein
MARASLMLPVVGSARDEGDEEVAADELGRVAEAVPACWTASAGRASLQGGGIVQVGKPELGGVLHGLGGRARIGRVTLNWTHLLL